jgi:hypothetical protein
MRHSIVTLVKFCLTFSVILPLSACMLSAQNDDNYATQNAQPSAMDGNKENREASSIEQIGSKPSKGNVATEQVAIVGSGTRSDNKDNIAIVQLPGNLEAISGTGQRARLVQTRCLPKLDCTKKSHKFGILFGSAAYSPHQSA